MNRAARGFVLPLTIWILVAVAVVAAYLAERVQKSLRLAQSRQQASEVQVDISNARAELLFRLATQGMSPCGLGVGPQCVALDGRPYQLGATILQLQDARGLLNLSRTSDAQIDSLLAQYGVQPDARPRLIDALRDYADADSLKRLNGAEAADYAARQQPPPRNAPLRTALELRAVLGWAEAPLWGVALGADPAPDAVDPTASARPPPIDQLVTVGSNVAINPNTAPPEVLRTLPGMTAELAWAVVERRRLEPVDVSLLDRLVGGGLTQMPPLVIAFPGTELQVTQSAPGLAGGLRYNLSLTPRGATAPWEVLSFYRTEAAAAPLARASRDTTVALNAAPPADKASDVPRFPPRTILPAAPAGLSGLREP